MCLERSVTFTEWHFNSSRNLVRVTVLFTFLACRLTDDYLYALERSSMHSVGKSASTSTCHP